MLKIVDCAAAGFAAITDALRARPITSFETNRLRFATRSSSETETLGLPLRPVARPRWLHTLLVIPASPSGRTGCGDPTSGRPALLHRRLKTKRCYGFCKRNASPAES